MCQLLVLVSRMSQHLIPEARRIPVRIVTAPIPPDPPSKPWIEEERAFFVIRSTRSHMHSYLSLELSVCLSFLSPSYEAFLLDKESMDDRICVGIGMQHACKIYTRIRA